ncbi:MAG: DMT family transporter [bacterium]
MGPVWFILSLLCAVSLSFADLFSKIALRHADIFLVSWVKMAFAFVILLAGLPWVRVPSISGHFVRTCLILFPLEVLVQLLYMKAIQVSPLSLTIPFLALSPIFLIATSFLMLGERIDRSGLAGILLIAVGSYMLNIDKAAYGFLSPLKAIAKEKGSWLMVVVAAIFSITSNLGKIAIQETNPFFFAVFFSGVMGVLLFPFSLLMSDRPARRIREHLPIFVGIGIAMSLTVLFHMMAIVRVEVPYMISIKRTSPIFSVLMGCIFLHELHCRERTLGSIIMTAGAVLILL